MNSDRENRGRRNQFRSERKKVAPSADLEILSPDGGNLITWLESLHRYLQREYNVIGQFIETNKLYVRSIPTTQKEITKLYPGLSPKQSAAMLKDVATDNYKNVSKDMADYVSMFGLIMSCLSKEGVDMVKENANWDTVNVAKDPLSLIQIIKNVHSLKLQHIDIDEARYVAMQRYQSIRHLPGVYLTDYRSAFEQCVENLVTLSHPSIPSPAEQARHFITRLDNEKHREFKIHCVNESRASGGNFPKTIQEACDRAKVFVPLVRVRANNPNPMVFSAEFTGTCYRCGKSGHKSKDCKSRKRDEEEKKSAEPKHTETDSGKPSSAAPPSKTAAVGDTQKQRKKGGQAKNKNKAAYSTHIDVSSGSGYEDIYGFPVHVSMDMMSVSYECDDTVHERDVSLDSLANHSFACNKSIMCNVRETSFSVNGVNGTDIGHLMGTLPCFGDIAYTPKSGRNGLALFEAQTRYRVDHEQLVHFTVHITDTYKLVFAYNSSTKAYTCRFTDEVLETLRSIEQSTSDQYIDAYPSTVSENESKFSKREVLGAQAARRLMKIMYFPSDAGLIRTLNTGTCLNAPITGKDVLTATAIYGKSPEALAGKAKDHGPTADVNVYVPVDERKEQTAYVDIFYWHGLAYIIFVIKPLHMLMTRHVEEKNIDNLKDAVQYLINLSVAQGFSISKIWTDPERALAQLKGRVSAPVETVGARAHVADIEVEIRILKERLRSTESGLPFKVSRKLSVYMVYGATIAMNAMPRTDRSVSPREKFLGVKLNFNKDCRAAFGEYVQATVMPPAMRKNTEKPRTVAAVALIPTMNGQGTYWFYDIVTKRAFTANNWECLPMPDLVIEQLNQLYDADHPMINKKAKRLRRTDTVTAAEARGVEENYENPVHDVTVHDDPPALLVQLPTARDLPERSILPDLTHAADDQIEITVTPTNQPLEDNFPTVHGNDNVEEAIMAQPVYESPATESGDVPILSPDGSDNTSQYVEDPAEYLESLGHHVVDGMRRSKRISRRMIESRTLQIYKMSVTKALKKCLHMTKDAILSELKQILEKSVWEYVDKAGLSKKQLKAVIRSYMFLKEKHDARGAFIKMKARLVAGGDCQDKELYENLSSPTVAIESVLMILAIAAIQNRKAVTIDITGAYLECVLPDGDEVIMELDAVLVKILSELDPNVKAYTDSNGKVYVRLKKALYGCVQSSKLWYEKLKSVLIAFGYVANDHDPCVFNKVQDEVQCTVAFHVDDLLVTCSNGEMINELIKHLEANFQQISVCTGSVHSYLGMNIVVDDVNRTITIDMISYTKKALESAVGTVRHASAPAGDNLFTVNENSTRLASDNTMYFHSMVAKLLYLAKRTRPQILTAISWLASRVQAPTDEDLQKLNRVLGYLAKTIDSKLRYDGKSNSNVLPECFIDASHAVHHDGTSRTGVVIMLAGAIIGAWSGKQKLVSKSSTEAELIALSDGLSHVLWVLLWLQDQGYDVKPVVVYQDNESVLALMRAGKKPSQRTKHMDIRYFFAKNRVEIGDITLKYMPTGAMLADLMTKPLVGEQFRCLASRMVGYA